MVAVVLVEPESPGNIGSVARVMKNFGFKELVLINPCKITEEAFKMARHGEDILKNAKIFQQLERALEPYDIKIATTGKTRNFITIRPEEIPKYESMCIVFGRESSGLTNEEINMCDLVVKIPASQEYPVLNLSHAVAIILYTLFEKSETKTPDVRSVKFWLDKISDEIDMKERFEILKNVIMRGLPRKNEADAISGVLKEIYLRIKK